QEVSMAVEEEIGTVNDFFARPVVAGIELTGTVKVGDTVHIKGHSTDITMVVESMEINNVKVQVANAKDSVGLKVPDRVRRGDRVYLVKE
ncbi:MAG: translation elongation factor-like protein, partial [Chloroflexota bacterium]